MNLLDVIQIKGYFLSIKLVWNSLSEEKKKDIRLKMKNLVEELFWHSNTDTTVLTEIQRFYDWMFNH